MRTWSITCWLIEPPGSCSMLISRGAGGGGRGPPAPRRRPPGAGAAARARGPAPPRGGHDPELDALLYRLHIVHP
jgi:hypothetical protein